MQGVLEALAPAGCRASATRLLFVSVDPARRPRDAADRLRAERGYAATLRRRRRGAAAIDALVGAPAEHRGAGRRRRIPRTPPADARRRALAHPAGLVIVTPDGRVARYLMGVRFDPVELRDAVDDAAGGRIARRSPTASRCCARTSTRAPASTATPCCSGLRGVGPGHAGRARMRSRGALAGRAR